jgi:flagellar secretion chaperone FliS
MPIVNPWKSYRRTATLTAPPGQIILMLFDGALRSLERARAGFSQQDPAEFNMAVNNNLQRALDIIRELNLALDMEKGGELAATLGRLYDYFERRLVESNFKKKPEGIDEVIRHLTVLRDAWAMMLRKEDVAVLPQTVDFAPAFATA